MCRFCFDGSPESGALISPCKCKGSQAFVHLSCLRRWQRMVLVSQPTHPAFQRDDVRHHECNVCKAEFTCPPPTRLELMQSFTGDEIASLLVAGSFIGARKEFSAMLTKELSENPLARVLGSYDHWKDGAYLITDVDEDTGLVRLEVDSPSMLALLCARLGASLELDADGRVYRVVAEGALAGSSEATLAADLQALAPPCILVLRSAASASDDTVKAVNLSRRIPITEEAPTLHRTQVAEARAAVAAEATEAAMREAAEHVDVVLFSGGPCEEGDVAAAIAFGGPCGFSVVESSTALRDAIKLAAQHVAAKGALPATAGRLVAGQSVRVKSLANRPAILEEWVADGEKWAVRMLGSGEAKRFSGDELEGLDQGVAGTVYAFFGYAGWSRAQLLGEIAKGHWGLCHSVVADLVCASTLDAWDALEDRLVFAPKTEMTDDYIAEAMTAAALAAAAASDT